MPEWIVVIILGIVEGITEFLPISSTGHLLLVEHWLTKHFGVAPQSDLFNTFVQSGAVMAVLLIFGERLKQMSVHWRTEPRDNYLLKLIVAFALTGAGGLILKKLHFRLPATSAPVAWATLVGGVLFVIVERWLRGRPLNAEVAWTVAIIVGLSQLLAAVFPGLSRSGATILMALVLGLSRPAATEFSFLLGIPTLLSAGGLELFKALRDPPAQSVDWAMLGLGFAVAAVTAFVAVKWLLRFVQSHTFVGFGWYRIILGALILALAR